MLGVRGKLFFTIQARVLQRIVYQLYSDDKKWELPPDLLEPPTNCCMSGCGNCVLIEYAEKLTKHFKDGGEKAQKIILEKIDDPNMKAFLLTELRCLKIQEKQK